MQISLPSDEDEGTIPNLIRCHQTLSLILHIIHWPNGALRPGPDKLVQQVPEIIGTMIVYPPFVMMGKKILKKLPIIVVYPPFVMMGKVKKKPFRKTESKEV